MDVISHVTVVEQPRRGASRDGLAPCPVALVASRATRRRIIAALDAAGARTIAEHEAIEALAAAAPEPGTIVIFACDVEDSQGIADLRRLRREAREAAIVVVSPPATGTGVRRTLDAGAVALVFDSELELTLAAAVQAVESGQSVVPRKLRAGVERPNLSHRERQVLTLVCEGFTNAEIARHLYLAESTIKSHLASVFTKFGVHSRREAAAVFAELTVGEKTTA